jgi:hypothetical protein
MSAPGHPWVSRYFRIWEQRRRYWPAGGRGRRPSWCRKSGDCRSCRLRLGTRRRPCSQRSRWTCSAPYKEAVWLSYYRKPKIGSHGRLPGRLTPAPLRLYFSLRYLISGATPHDKESTVSSKAAPTYRTQPLAIAEDPALKTPHPPHAILSHRVNA